LFAAGGNVTIDADKINGGGSAIAFGTPTITINNQSPDYLVLNSITIPDLPGGSVLFTGAAKGGITVTEHNPGTGGTILIHDTFAGSVGNSSYGPAILVVGNVTNLGGLITISNDSGSIFTANTAGIFGQQVVISAPQGVVLLSKSADAPFLGS